METEFGVFAWNEFKNSDQKLLSSFIHKLRQYENNKFNKFGEKFYIDYNDHPEIALPEEVSAVNLAQRVIRGYIHLADLGKLAIDNIADDKELAIIANNSDQEHNTWGTHENYLISSVLGVANTNLQQTLANFRAIRQVWSGAGGVIYDDKAPNSMQFVLSERILNFNSVVGDDSVKDRPLYHTRDEKLASQFYSRVHDISGESNISPTVNALKTAMSSLIIRAVELDVDFSDLYLANPVESSHQISTDPDFQNIYLLNNHQKMTALDLNQAMVYRAYEKCLEYEYLTIEEKTLALKLFDLIDQLKNDPDKTLAQLDWPIKKRIYDKQLAKNRHNLNSEQAFKIVWEKLAKYHQIFPVEGYGMQLLRRGYFKGLDDFPDITVDLPLPQTRALLRVQIMDILNKRGIKYKPDWGSIDINKLQLPNIKLENPYKWDIDQIMEGYSFLKSSK